MPFVVSTETKLKNLDTPFTRSRIGAMAAAAVLLVVSSWSQVVLAQGVRHPLRRAMPRIPAVSTPEEQGMDSATLAAGIDFLLENRETYRVHSVVVIRNDRVVLDARFYPFSRSWRHDLASVTKDGCHVHHCTIVAFMGATLPLPFETLFRRPYLGFMMRPQLISARSS